VGIGKINLSKTTFLGLFLAVGFIVGISFSSVYAGIPWGTSEIADNAITSIKIKNQQVKTADVKNKAIKSKKILDGTIQGVDIDVTTTIGADRFNVGTDNPGDDDIIGFDDGTEQLFWDESQTRFEVTEDLAIAGPIQAGSITAAPVTYNRFGASATSDHGMNGVADVFIQDNLEVNGLALFDGDITVGTNSASDDDSIHFDIFNAERLFWDDSENRFEFTDDLVLTSDATSPSVQLILGDVVGEQSFLVFDGGTESLNWQGGATDRFSFTDDVIISGKLTVTGPVDPPMVTFSAENHDSIKQLSADVEDHEEVALFWNTESKRLEVYVISEDKFYTMTGEPIE